MSNVTEQVRESLAKGERMSLKQLADLNCWGPEDKRRASVAFCNMRTRGELASEAGPDGEQVHHLVHAIKQAPRKLAAPEQPFSTSNADAWPQRHDATENASEQAERNVQSIRMQQLLGSEPALDPGVELVAAIIREDGGDELRVELLGKKPNDKVVSDDAAPKDPGAFEIQRVTLAEYVPAQLGVRLFLHRAGDVTVETVRSHHGQERVLIPRKHVRDVARKLLEFIGEA